MHRTLFRPRALLLGGLVFALLLSGRPRAVEAQIPGTSGSGLMVPIGGTVPLQMSNKKAISLVKNTKENVLGIRTVPGDPTRVLLVGQEAGITHVDLTDVDGKTEGYDITVQLDVEYLRSQLRRALPTANIEPIPIANNTIVLRGTVNHLEDVDAAVHVGQAAAPGAQIVPDLRVAGVQQVQLCVTVAQVSRTEFRRMAFDFLTNSKNWFLGSTVGQAVVEPPSIGIGSTLNVTQFGQALNGVPGLPNGAPTNLLFGVIHNRWGFLAFLQALRDENVVKTLNEPTVTTMSGRPASFLLGGEQAIPVPAGLGQVGVQFEEFGTRLNVVPIVLGNGKIHLEIEPEVSALNAANGTSISGTVVPGRSTIRENTTVELEDGQTFVLGGLVENNVTGSTEKVPVLGDLPFFGAAFSTKSYQEEETEMVILVTPHLVDAEDCSQVAKVLPGQETRSPDDFELFLEGILEAPRGPRQVFEDHRYVAPYKNSPTAQLFPCAGQGGCNGACQGGANGSCGCASTDAPLSGSVMPPAAPRAKAEGKADPVAQPLPADAPKLQPVPAPKAAADEASAQPPAVAPEADPPAEAPKAAVPAAPAPLPGDLPPAPPAPLAPGAAQPQK